MTDTIGIKDIQEVVITKNQSTGFEKELKVKWSFKENEELVSFFKHTSKEDKDIKVIRFKLINTSNERQVVAFKIYKSENQIPADVVYEHRLVLEANDEINQIEFGKLNALLKKESIFIGF